jgi:competence protein ComEC
LAAPPVLDLRPPVRLELWALMLAVGVLVGTVVPPLSPMLVLASVIVSAGVLVWRELVPAEWRLMAILAPLFAACGVGISFLHSATPDPLAELAALEPGEVVVVGKIASAPVPSGYGYRADLRVEHLWHHNQEVVRGGGVEVFAVDLSGVGVGDRVRVDGGISLPEPGEDGFDYARYLSTKRISAVIEATGVWPVGEHTGWIAQVHRRTDAALAYGLRPQEAAVVRGMVLGDRSLIPEDLELAFQRSGVTQMLTTTPTPVSTELNLRLAPRLATFLLRTICFGISLRSSQLGDLAPHSRLC